MILTEGERAVCPAIQHVVHRLVVISTLFVTGVQQVRHLYESVTNAILPLFSKESAESNSMLSYVVAVHSGTHNSPYPSHNWKAGFF